MYPSRGARPDNAVPLLPFYGMCAVTSDRVTGPLRSIMRVIFADFRHCCASEITLSLNYHYFMELYICIKYTL